MPQGPFWTMAFPKLMDVDPQTDEAFRIACTKVAAEYLTSTLAFLGL